ncbi:UNVERIFIED_CONTAM: hypothetical protein Sindi_2671700 [Sesamum indicum]
MARRECRNILRSSWRPHYRKEQTPVSHVMQGMSTPWGDAAQMDWAQRMVFDTAEPAVWSSNYNQDGVPDDGTKLCRTDTGPSSYYGRSPYDYVSGLADRFHDIVHATKQPFWNGCTNLN